MLLGLLADEVLGSGIDHRAQRVLFSLDPTHEMRVTDP